MLTQIITNRECEGNEAKGCEMCEQKRNQQRNKVWKLPTLTHAPWANASATSWPSVNSFASFMKSAHANSPTAQKQNHRLCRYYRCNEDLMDRILEVESFKLRWRELRGV